MGAFVGRDRELSLLEAALAEVRGGRGRLFLIVGEAGIGKTRLADELTARAGDEVRVLWGRCWEAGGAPAYWPWIEVLRPLLAEGDAAKLAAELGPAAVPLAKLIPELADRLPGLAAVSRDESEQTRFLLFDAIARFLRGAAARTPLVLVLDDLHVADRASLRLLEFVARTLRTTRALVIGTYRDADARLLPEVAELLAKIEREGERVPLGRLKGDDVAALIEAASGRAADQQVVAAVLRTTEGTPLFVSEVVRAVVAGTKRAGETLPGRLLVPDGLQPAIRGHLAHISDEARAVLRPASVIGREFSLPLLRAVATASGPAPGVGDVADLLGEAERAGLVERTDDVPARYRFSHILIRETIYRDLAAAERERLHGRAGDALVAQGAATRADRMAELAHHYLRAGAGVARANAVLYARRAGEEALRAFAHEEATAHFEQALAALEDSGPEASHARGELLIALAEALQHGGEAERARQASARAADCARGAGDPELLARAALSLGAEFRLGFVDGTLVSLLEEALTALTDTKHPLRARVMARLAAARQPAPDPEQPIALAREAMALARAIGDRRALALVLRDARAAYLPLDSLEERTALDLEALALAYESHDRLSAVHAHRRLFAERVEEGQIAAALGHLDQYDRLCEELRQPHRKLSSLLRRASVHALLGDFAQAERLIADAEPLAAAAQDHMAKVDFVGHSLNVRWCAQRFDGMRGLEAQLAEMAARSRQAEPRVMRAVMRARMGDRDFARAEIPSLPLDQIHPRFGAQTFVGEVALAIGDMGAVEIVYERLRPWARRFIYFGGCEGSYSLSLGQLAAGLGRLDEARQHFEDAIADNTRIGARPWVALVSMAYADVLDGAGVEGDGRRARELRATARGIAEELGMPALLARLAEREDGRASMPAAATPAPAAAAAPTFELEGEYWTIGWDGRAFRLKNSKGLQMLAYLVKNPGREFHALHLAGLTEGHEGGDVLIEAAAGPAADADARAAYKRRAEELREQLSEAEQNSDLGRADRARQELDMLADELARGVGLGGRERKTGGSAERARINVQRRLSDAVSKIEEACPPLGRSLQRALRTGAYCSYEPA